MDPWGTEMDEVDFRKFLWALQNVILLWASLEYSIEVLVFTLFMELNLFSGQAILLWYSWDNTVKYRSYVLLAACSSLKGEPEITPYGEEEDINQVSGITGPLK